MSLSKITSKLNTNNFYPESIFRGGDRFTIELRDTYYGRKIAEYQYNKGAVVCMYADNDIKKQVNNLLEFMA